MVAPGVDAPAAPSEQPVNVPRQVGGSGEAGVHAVSRHDQARRKVIEAVIQKESVPFLMTELAEAAVESTRVFIESPHEPPVRRTAASVGRTRENKGDVHVEDVGTSLTDEPEQFPVPR